MGMNKFFLLLAIISISVVLRSVVLVCAQDQSGFISLDCGIVDGSSYTDETTRIEYVSDAAFISTGVRQNISSKINTKSIQKQYLTLRSFPDGSKSCYKLNATKGKNFKYLIRAAFLYGNYDNKNDIPRFDLYLGVNWWDTVALYDATTVFTVEIIHAPPSDHIEICVVNTGFGIPFISVLELRPLNNDIYKVNGTGSLQKLNRYDYGSTGDQPIRFPADIYDRIWSPRDNPYWEILRTTSTVNSPSRSEFQMPSTVMQTAATVNASYGDQLTFQGWRNDPNTQFYLYFHLAELQDNHYREFDIYSDDYLWFGPFSPLYLQTTTLRNITKQTSYDFVFNKTENSTLWPLINAFEVYFLKDFLQSETYPNDVEAILKISSTYGLKRYWQGDPCAPAISIWEGLNCSYRGYKPPRIISLNLSSSGLTGPITSAISNLRMLKFLDLSNNSLTGPVPDFLSQLKFLRVLDLSRNKLYGSVPIGLYERSNNGTLELNVHKNPKLCSSNTCKKNSRLFVPVVVTIGSVFFALLIAAITFWTLKRRRQPATPISREISGLSRDSMSKEHHFGHSEVLSITNNLESALGEGKSATVYHGYLDGVKIVVKIFFPSFVHGYKQFPAEARLLTRVHHRNLTACFGYCNEEPYYKALIYEYMPNGNLQGILYDQDESFLSWQERLQVAVDVAQGLEFLHNGCNPPIIHGNLKPTNILLDENFHAKLVDFGLSKVLTTEYATAEYLDPEYFITNKFIERHDVYSFGIILLATITSQPVVANNPVKTHIIQRVRSLLGKRDINSIVDQRLKGDFHSDCAWKAVELAMACVSSSPSKNRPTMIRVVKELNQCLAMEIARLSRFGGTTELVSVNMSTELSSPER